MCTEKSIFPVFFTTEAWILLLSWTLYLLVTNFMCHFNNVHFNYLELHIKQAQKLC